MDLHDIKKIIHIAKPLIWYYAVTGMAAMLPASARISASARVTASSLICIPLLAWWYAQERYVKVRPGPAPCPGQMRAAGGKNGLQQRPPVPAGYVIACFLAGAALSALSAHLMELCGMYDRFSNAVQEGYRESPAIWLILGPGLLAPVCEELVFRGLLYGQIRRELREMPAAGAAVISSLIFAMGHGNMIQFLYAFPMGLLLCAVSELPRSAVRGTACETAIDAEADRLPGSGRPDINLLLPVALHLGANLYSAAAALGAFGFLRGLSRG